MSRLKPFFIMKEIWKDIPDYEGIYQVSSFGRVKSLKREVNHFTGSRVVNEKILKQKIDPRGYCAVGLSKLGCLKVFEIHRLVAKCFLKREENVIKLVVDHIDNNKLNNKLENLQITTNRENSSKDKFGGSSKYVGVCFKKDNKKWYSRIQINGKSKFLGYFKTEIDAYLAYQKKLKEINSLILIKCVV